MRDLVDRRTSVQLRAVTQIRAAGTAAIEEVLRHINVGSWLSCDFGHISDGLLDVWCGDDPRAQAVTEVEIYNASLISDHGLTCLARLPHLRSLRLVEGQATISDNGLADLARTAKGLRSLELWNCERITERGIAALGSLPHLGRVSLSNVATTDATLAILGRFPALTEVHIGGSKGISDAGVLDLVHHRPLRGLGLTCQRGISDAALRTVAAACPGLEVLDLSHVPSCTGQGLQAIASHGQLRWLDISGTDLLDDATLAALSRCRNLTSLFTGDMDDVSATGWGWLEETCGLRECRLGGAHFDDAAARALAVHRELREVQLRSSVLGSEGLATLLALPELRSLEIHDNVATTAEALRPAAGHPHLQTLSSWGCAEDGDLAVEIAATIRELVRLRLPQAQPSARGLRALGQCAHLRTLRLDAGRLRDDDLMPLVNCRDLRHLDLLNAGGLTAASLAAIAELPHLRRLMVLDGYGIDDTVFDLFLRLPRLRAYALPQSPLTAASIASFCSAMNLTPLSGQILRQFGLTFIALDGQFIHREEGDC